MSSEVVDRRDISLIRPLPGGSNTPLTPKTQTSVPYGQTIYTMQITGFHSWGFVIERSTLYANVSDELWGSFMARIRADAESTMTRKPPGRPRDEVTPALLLPLLRWDVLGVYQRGF